MLVGRQINGLNIKECIVLKHKWSKSILFTLFGGSLFAATPSTFVFNAQTTPDIVRAVNFARSSQKAVITQGEGLGTIPENKDGVVYLNLRDYKSMVDLRLKNKSMRVESGMTWSEAQRLAAPFGLALKFIPAKANEPIFASININQSGLSPQSPLVADGVDSFRLLKPDGRVVDVSPSKTPELWRGIFGAQGVLGVVLDVQLKLVKNKNLRRQAYRMSYSEYPTYLHEQVQDNSDINATFARMDVAPGKQFLEDMYAVSYWVKDEEKDPSLRLHPVRDNIARSIYEWSEKGDWERKVRWQIEKALLGNAALHSKVTRADLLLRQVRTTDEHPMRLVYYIPVTQFVPFMDNLRSVAIDKKWALHQVSMHYLAKPSGLLLAPQQGDMLAINISVTKASLSLAEQKEVAPVLMGLALSHGGSFALNQFSVQDMAKLTSAYPKLSEFQRLRLKYDKDHLFASVLYPRLA